MTESSKTIPAPLVLAISASMVAIGGVLLWQSTRTPGPNENPVVPTATLVVDDTTPERVAESFLDAWRKRQWEVAERLSIEKARGMVQEKKARDNQLPEEDQEMARQLWYALARAPLSLQFQSTSLMENGDRILNGIAGYDLVGQPYRREMRFVVRADGERFRVVEMEALRVLTEPSELLRGSEEAPQ